MNYIHYVFIILTGLLFVTEWKCIPRERQFVVDATKVHHQVLMQVTLGSTCITAEKVMVLGNMQSWKTTKVLLGWGEIRHQSAYLKMNAFSAIHLEPVSR